MVLSFLRRGSRIYTLRQHRARSVVITDAELVEVRHPASADHPGPREPPPAHLGQERPLHSFNPISRGRALLRQRLPRRHPSSSPASPSRSRSRSRSHSPDYVSDAQLTYIRASQRTFEGAYIRTALGQFSFALVVLKIFTAEFYSIGALFAAYGGGVLIVSLYRRHQGNRQFFEILGEDGLQRKRFRTSGNVVMGLTALSVCAYTVLLALVVRLL